jgi:hypothetical protein
MTALTCYQMQKTLEHSNGICCLKKVLSGQNVLLSGVIDFDPLTVNSLPNMHNDFTK